MPEIDTTALKYGEWYRLAMRVTPRKPDDHYNAWWGDGTFWRHGSNETKEIEVSDVEAVVKTLGPPPNGQFWEPYDGAYDGDDLYTSGNRLH